MDVFESAENAHSEISYIENTFFLEGCEFEEWIPLQGRHVYVFVSTEYSTYYDMERFTHVTRIPSVDSYLPFMTECYPGSFSRVRLCMFVPCHCMSKNKMEHISIAGQANIGWHVIAVICV